MAIRRPYRRRFRLPASQETYAVEPLERRTMLTVFANAGLIDIPVSGTANPYPSEIAVSGMTGNTIGITATLNDVNHTWPDDIDVLLVSPTGQSVVLMSDAGGGDDVDNINLTFTDAGPGSLSDNGPALVTGTYFPTNHAGESDDFPSPAPGGAPSGTTMSHFHGADPNGTWSLYVSDPFPADSGSIEGGWSLNITTVDPSSADAFEPNDSFGAAANLGTLGDRTENGLTIHDPGNEDFYVFTAAETGPLSVDIDFTHANGDLDLYLYNSAEMLIDESEGTGNDEHVETVVTAGLTYYIRVIGFNNAVNAYNMVIDGLTSGGLTPDAFEENDNFGDASIFGVLGDRVENDLTIDAPFDDDFYFFTADAGGMATVDISFIDDNGDLDLLAYDANHNELDGSFGVGNSEQVEFPVVAGESYYVHVFGGSDVNAYAMVIHSPIGGQPLYALEQTVSSSRLTRFDRGTGAIVQRFPEQGTIQLSALAYDDSTDTMFGYDHGVGLYTVDLTTGAFTLLSGSALTIHSLAVQPGTNTLFGLTLEGSLYTLNKSNGAATLVGSDTAAIDFAHGLTFGPGGTLYASDTLGTGTSNLLTINPANGDATIVATINRDFVVGLAFDSAGTLYGSDNGTDTLFTINTLSGAATTVGSFGIDLAHNAIEFLPDSVQPTANIVDISPDPINAGVHFATIKFSEPIDPTTFTLSDIALTRDGGGNLLSGNSLTTMDNVTWTLHGLANLTDEAGLYNLTLSTNINDPSGNAVSDNAQDTWLNRAVSGGAADDTIRLVRSLTPDTLDVFINNFSSTPDYSVLLSNFGETSMQVLGHAGNDTLILDLENGAPAPSFGTTYFGGPADFFNLLSVYGSDGADTVTFNSSSVETNGRTTNFAQTDFVLFEGNGGLDAVTVNDGAGVIITASQQLDSLDIADGGFVAMSPSGSNVLSTRGLSIAPTGKLDLADNDLVVDHDGVSPLEDVQALIVSGYNGGDWLGFGIVSSVAELDSTVVGLAYSENVDLPVPYGSTLGGPTFNGEDVDDTAFLVKFTYVGDLNLDGFIDFGDLSVFNTNYDNGLSTGRFWFEGDFNHDGFIEFQDLSLFYTNYDPNKPQL